MKIDTILDQYHSRKKKIAEKEGSKIDILLDLIQNCKGSIDMLKYHASGVGFIDEAQEIFFYKIASPKVMSDFIYYNKVLQYENEHPFPSTRCHKKYIKCMLKRIKEHKRKNRYLYKYHFRKMSHYDSAYFVKAKTEINLFYVDVVSYYDPDFFTFHSFKLSQVMANLKLEKFFVKEKEKIKESKTTQNNQEFNPNISWTGSKTDLVELIYGLKASGSISGGQITIKEMTQVFSKLFKVNINNHYKIFSEIRNRSRHRTKFIDNLSQSLNEKLDYDDAL